MALLAVNDLKVQYGQIVALREITFAVKRSSILTILGRNGAGKSSLLNAIAGSIRPTGGRIVWQGEEITTLAAERRVQAGIALVPEGRRVFPGLTVTENLRLGGFHLSRSDFEAALERVSALFPILAERSSALAGNLSGGQQQMLAIGRALMSGADLLLLDEPSLGLAPLIIDEVYDQLHRLRERGLTMILVEQHVQRALNFADQALVLNLGRIVLREAPEVLAQDPRLIASYMGDGAT